LEETFFILTTKEADKLVDLLRKVKNGDVLIDDVTKVAGNVVEISYKTTEKRGMLTEKPIKE